MREEFYNLDQAKARAIQMGGGFLQIFPNVIYVSRHCPGSFLGTVLQVAENGATRRCL